jgi:uncharacterized membrane protein YkgB
VKSTIPARQGFLANAAPIGMSITGTGAVIARIGLLLVFLLIGILKFSQEEANGIQAFIAPSPFFSWLNLFLNHQQLSDIFGALEISTGLLIISRPFSPVASAIGSAMGIGTFLTTISFFFTTPGVWDVHHGFPILSHVGEFLIKDVTLLGACVFTLGEALQAASKRSKGDDTLAQ